MEYCCPKCGNKLVKGEKYYVCSQKHLWEIWQPNYSPSEWHLREIKWATCPVCLDDFPAPDMDYSSKKCSACHKKEQDEWKLDSEKSYARLTITPVATAEGKYYNLDTHIEIRPYPNPFSFGGMYGGGGVKDEARLEKAIEAFNNEVEKWKKHGMTDIKIVREEQVLTRQVVMEPSGKELGFDEAHDPESELVEDTGEEELELEQEVKPQLALF